MAYEAEMSCCVVIPVYSGSLTISEQASLINTLLKLSDWQIILIKPAKLDLTKLSIQIRNLVDTYAIKLLIMSFDDSFFRSIKGYNRLLLSPSFYLQFLDWNYMLIVQLDAWIFRDDLDTWLKQDYSYIGGPWLSLCDLPKGLSVSSESVGNGGLSLRRVRDMVEVCKPCNFNYKPILGLKELLNAHQPFLMLKNAYSLKSLLRFFNRILIVFARLCSWHNSLSYYAATGINEDIIISAFGPRVLAGFVVAPPEMAARFALDADPFYFYASYIKTGLPFGCHAWEKHDLSFWRKLDPGIGLFGEGGRL